MYYCRYSYYHDYQNKKTVLEINSGQNKVQNQETEKVSAGITDGDNIITDVTSEQIVDLSNSATAVKEITMTSFYEIIDGKPKPQYSVKEIIVKKDDTLKINITVTKGKHDFKIDEYNVSVDTALNQTVTVEFKADKAGKFIYYCSMPEHCLNGYWGVLNVVE